MSSADAMSAMIQGRRSRSKTLGRSREQLPEWKQRRGSHSTTISSVAYSLTSGFPTLGTEPDYPRGPESQSPRVRSARMKTSAGLVVAVALLAGCGGHKQSAAEKAAMEARFAELDYAMSSVTLSAPPYN